MSKVYANTFQTFNIYVDRAMQHLTDAELRVLLYATRHIMGWQDKITSRTGCLSLTMFEKGFTIQHDNGEASTFGGCGLSRPVISKTLNSLEALGFIERAGFEQDKGQRWRLAEQPDWDALEARSADRDAANKRRTEKATAKRIEARSNVARTTSEGVVTSHVNSAEEYQNGVVTSDVNMVFTSDVPKQTQVQTQEEKNADADASAHHNGDKVIPFANQRSPRPWYDAIFEAWGFTGGRNGEMEKMLLGKATRKGYKQYNLDKPLDNPAQLLEWKRWYLTVKQRGMNKPVLVSSPEKVQSSIGEWQALASQSRQASPAAAEQDRIRRLRMEAERAELDRINAIARGQTA